MGYRSQRSEMIVALCAALFGALVARGADLGDRAGDGQLVGNDRATPESLDGGDSEDGKPSAYRMREGTQLVHQTGRFRPNGDSLTYVDEHKHEMTALPNLNLERVLRLLKTVDEPESVSWTVSGLVTEYSGQNYLLITRAVYKAAASPAAAAPAKN